MNCLVRNSRALLAAAFVGLACAAPARANDVTAPTAVTVTESTVLPAPELATRTSADDSPHRVLASAYFGYNSAWEPGVAVSYSHREFLDGRPRFQLAYETTRLYTAAGSLTLNEDRLRLLAGWYFRPGERVNPGVNLGIGYTRFDREDAAFALLDNDAVGALVQGGLDVSLLAGFSAYGNLGFEVLSSSTVYPLSVGFGVHYDFEGVLP